MSELRVSQLLRDWSAGDEAALKQLMPLVYDELRRLANYYMRRQRPGHTLQATALVNEAYLKLINAKAANWKDRAHFFAVAARAMRQILTDHARSRKYGKRGGGAPRVELEQAALVAEERAGDLIALDDALNSLAAINPRMKQIVELRFFGGLSIEETADVMKISEPTVQREWRMAKAWLHRQISRENTNES